MPLRRLTAEGADQGLHFEAVVFFELTTLGQTTESKAWTLVACAPPFSSFTTIAISRTAIARCSSSALHDDTPMRRSNASWPWATMWHSTAVLALSLMGDYSSNTVLGRALVDRDRGVRTIAETGIREFWCRVGSRQQQEMFREVADLNDQRQHSEAARLATELIHSSPWIAEAWCQRGTANYHLGQYDAAIRDCHQALEINPYHFTAAAGMGQCYMLQENPVAALEAFRRALRLNPGMDEVRPQIVRLQRSLKRE